MKERIFLKKENDKNNLQSSVYVARGLIKKHIGYFITSAEFKSAGIIKKEEVN